MEKQIVYLPTESLIPYVNNPRINEQGVDAVAGSIKEFGFNSPIAVDKDKVVINGHTRLLAAKKLGLSEVPCVICDNLCAAQVKAYRLADNRVAELSAWDDERLKVELETISDICKTDILSLVIPGFDSDFLQSSAEFPDCFAESDIPEIRPPSNRGKADSENENSDSEELNTDDFAEEKFTYSCPKCGFRW